MELTQEQLQEIALAWGEEAIVETEKTLAEWQRALNAGEKKKVTWSAVKNLIDGVPLCAMQLEGFADVDAEIEACERLKGDQPAKMVAKLTKGLKKFRDMIGGA